MQKQGAPKDHRGISRRQWLLFGASTAGVGLVAGGAWLNRRWGILESVGAVAQPMKDHRVLPAGGDVLSIVHGPSPEQNVRAALDALGGMARFVTPKDRVLIKPNIAWDRRPEQATTTDPRVVAAVIRACREVGAEQIRVIDCPVDDAMRCYHITGIAAAARDAGAEVLLPSESPSVHVKIDGHDTPWPIREAFVWADKIINVPIAKHHGSARVTAGMKNWIGITDKRRGLFHADLSASIVALAELVKPTLTIIDATRILMRNGPRGGNYDDVRLVNALAASLDPVAADAWAAEQLGIPVEQVSYLKRAEERGLGTVDWRKLAQREIRLG